MKLFELSNDYQRLMCEIDSADELTQEELHQRLEGLEESIEEKAKSIGAIIKNMEADLFAIAKAREEMEERETRLAKKINGLREYLKMNLEKCHIKEVKSPWFDVKIKLNPVAVIVDDERNIPSQFYEVCQIKKLNRILLKSSLIAGEQIQGVYLKQGTRLEIR